jgi:PKD repeat protein
MYFGFRNNHQMKKFYFSTSTLFVFCLLTFVNSQAQLVRLSNGFDNYIGSTATVPAGWHITWNSTSSPSYYITAGNYGTAIPSYKFGVTQDTIASPYFLSGDTLSFWCKGQGAFSTQNVLSIYISEDSITWNQLLVLDSLSVTGTIISVPLPCSAHYLKFIYYQVSGNLAFDDVKVTMTNYFPVAIPTTPLNFYCEGDIICFFDQSTMAGCDSICSRQWDFGDGTPPNTQMNPCHYYAVTGTYVVTLIVIACNGNADTSLFPVTVSPTPVSQFSDSNTTGTIVSFNDLSSVSSGNIVTWQWDFGDMNFSAQQNPTHFYSSIGTYYVCLTVVSNDGCTNTVCDSVNVIGVGTNEYGFSKEISVGPNPANDKLFIISYSSYGIEVIDILNTMGQSVLKHQTTNDKRQITLDVSQLSDGIYFLTLNTGPKIFFRKIVVEK